MKIRTRGAATRRPPGLGGLNSISATAEGVLRGALSAIVLAVLLGVVTGEMFWVTTVFFASVIGVPIGMIAGGVAGAHVGNHGSALGATLRSMVVVVVFALAGALLAWHPGMSALAGILTLAAVPVSFYHAHQLVRHRSLRVS